MLTSLKINKFTVFEDAQLSFSKGLNICIGENSTGKTHILKLVYAILKSLGKNEKSKEELEKRIAKYLSQVFMPDHLGRLVARRPYAGQTNATIEATWGKSGKLGFKFSTRASKNATVTEYNYEQIPAPSLFIPPKEILSIYSGFRQALTERELNFDITYLDLAKALDAAPLKGPRLELIRRHLDIIESIMAGDISKNEQGFYFYSHKGRGNLEAPLMAEGLRKLGMLAYLLRNGALTKRSTLLWDEPEANLNPRLIKQMAEILFKLSQDMQVIVATHSLFLLKEFEILESTHRHNRKNRPFTSYISLYLADGLVNLEQTKSIDELSSVVALDEELAQDGRYLELED